MPVLSVDPARLRAARLAAGDTAPKWPSPSRHRLRLSPRLRGREVVPHSPKPRALAALYGVTVEERIRTEAAS